MKALFHGRMALSKRYHPEEPKSPVGEIERMAQSPLYNVVDTLQNFEDGNWWEALTEIVERRFSRCAAAYSFLGPCSEGLLEPFLSNHARPQFSVGYHHAEFL